MRTYSWLPNDSVNYPTVSHGRSNESSDVRLSPSGQLGFHFPEKRYNRISVVGIVFYLGNLSLF
jgi:hypothetical protein